jgi:hypothetical protein
VGDVEHVTRQATRSLIKSLPPAYEVEFVDSHGVTQAFVTILEADLKSSVASRFGRVADVT